MTDKINIRSLPCRARRALFNCIVLNIIRGLVVDELCDEGGCSARMGGNKLPNRVRVKRHFRLTCPRRVVEQMPLGDEAGVLPVVAWLARPEPTSESYAVLSW